ncbi:MAG TPA: DUF2927 domain-containing protein [Dongiaceae bacterium]|nr:DUF2927 domain-containing protein [Dongiaceae bacterium]
MLKNENLKDAEIGLMNWKKLMVCLLLAAGAQISISHPLFAEDSKNLPRETSNTIVQLLSQTIHLLTPSILTDRVRKWDAKTIQYKILSDQPAPKIEQALATVETVLKKVDPTLALQATESNYDADILIVFDSQSSSVMNKYAVDLKRFYSIDGQHLSDQMIANVAHLYDSDINDCVWFLAHDLFALKKTLIFVSTSENPEKVDKCINNALIVSLGLSQQLVQGSSVRSSTAPLQSELTRADRLALEILYQPTVHPGDTIQQAITNFERVNITEP